MRRGSALLPTLGAVAVGRHVLVRGAQVVEAVVVPSADVVDGVSAGLAAQVAHAVVEAQHPLP